MSEKRAAKARIASSSTLDELCSALHLDPSLSQYLRDELAGQLESGDVAKLAKALVDVEATTQRMFEASMREFAERAAAGAQVRPSWSDIGPALLFLIMRAVNSHQRNHHIVATSVSAEKMRLWAYILTACRLPPFTGGATDEIAALHHFHTQIRELLKHRNRRLVIDEVQVNSRVVESIVSFVHSEAMAGMISGKLILLGTPSIGDAPPIQLPSHTAGKVVTFLMPSMNLLEVRALLTKYVGRDIPIMDLLHLWSLFDGVPGLYRANGRAIRALLAAPQTASAANAAASVPDSKSGPGASTGAGTAAAIQSGVGLGWNSLFDSVKAQMKLNEGVLSKSEVTALRTIPAKGRSVRTSDIDYDVLHALSRRGCVDFVPDAHAAKITTGGGGGGGDGEESKFVVIKDRAFSAGIGLEDAIQSVVMARQESGKPAFPLNITSKPLEANTKFQSLEFYYKNSDVDGLYYSDAKDVLIVVTAKLDARLHFAYDSKTEAEVQQFLAANPGKEPAARRKAELFLTDNVYKVLVGTQWGNQLKRIIILAAVPTASVEEKARICEFYTGAHQILVQSLTDPKAKDKRAVLSGLEFGAVTLDELVGSVQSDVTFSFESATEEDSWPLLLRDRVTAELKQLMEPSDPTVALLVRGRRMIGKTLTCRKLSANTADHFYVNLNDVSSAASASPTHTAVTAGAVASGAAAAAASGAAAAAAALTRTNSGKSPA